MARPAVCFPGGPHGPGGAGLYRAFWEQADPMSCGDMAQLLAWLLAVERRGMLGWEGGITVPWDWEHPEHPAGVGRAPWDPTRRAAPAPSRQGVLLQAVICGTDDLPESLKKIE